MVRVGDTVRRPAGPWTPAVHALLDHLEASGFTEAPRALGRDAEGREVVTYAEGDVVWPDHFDVVAFDRALAEIASLIRHFHDVAASFTPPADAEWWDLAADPSGANEVICHNDLAPWNLVRGADRGWTFIDWDLAAPGRRSWDLGWALLSFIPLTPGRPLEDEAIVRRLRVFMDAYGAPEELEAALAGAVERGAHEAARIRGHDGGVGAAYVKPREEGHAEIWAGAAERVARDAERWISRIRT